MAPISTMPSAAITGYLVSLHQEKPMPSGLRGGSEQGVEKFRLRRGVGRQLAVVQEFRQRGLRLGALHAVDRIGVIAGDRQQALDAGKPRLRVVVVGFFRQIDRRPFRRIGRLRRGETRLLAHRTAARIGDLEIAVANAELGMSGSAAWARCRRPAACAHAHRPCRHRARRPPPAGIAPGSMRNQPRVATLARFSSPIAASIR